MPAIRAFAEQERAGTDRVVLLGMGGSSLAPEVYASTFGSSPGHPSLTVLDSTHPEAVRAVSGAIDPARTLFLVASKSGGTIETLSLFRYFWRLVSSVHGRPGDRFVALTDPGSGLEALAGERGFRRVFTAAAGRRRALLSAHAVRPGPGRPDRHGRRVPSGEGGRHGRRVRAGPPGCRQPGTTAGGGHGRIGAGRPGQAHLHLLAGGCWFRRLDRAAGSGEYGQERHRDRSGGR